MAKRFKLSKRSSKRNFTKHAVKVNRRNVGPGAGFVMRGGIRM